MTALVFQASPHYLEGKQGKLEMDDKGYYKLLIGMYNAPNSLGDVYLLTAKVNQLFAKSTAADWAKDARLYGEANHPDISDFVAPGRSMTDAVAMLLHRSSFVPTDMQNHHIRSFWHETMDKKVDGRTIIGVYGWIKPLTPRLTESLNNPEENTGMSVRSLVGSRSPTGMGNYLIEQKDLITWDGATVTGIHGVGKYTSAGFESGRASSRIELNNGDSESFTITPEVIKSLAEAHQARGGMESDCHMITQMIKDNNNRWIEKENLTATLTSRAWVKAGR